MAVETELKLRVEAHEPIRQRLAAIGATFIRRVVETNCILDRLDGYLRRLGCGLRVRSVVDADGESLETTLTFKGPRRVSDVKSREELEVITSDAQVVMQILQRLGFRTVLCYQKRRESWTVGECRVELDEPVHLGTFVEIEGPDVAAIRAVQRELLLTDSKPVNVSYVGMLMAYRESQGLSNPTLTFPGGHP